MNLADAKVIAGIFIDNIKPFCTRIEVAGSVRRGKPEVKDIEIVCIPKTGESIQPVLVGEPIRKEINFLHEYLQDALIDRQIHLDRVSRDGKKAPFGPRYYRLTFEGYPLDLFAVLPPAQWGVIFTIRTGPAEYSKWLVTEALRRGFKVMDGVLYDVRGKENWSIIHCEEEGDFFQALGLAWMEPSKRSVP